MARGYRVVAVYLNDEERLLFEAVKESDVSLAATIRRCGLRHAQWLASKGYRAKGQRPADSHQAESQSDDLTFVSDTQ